MTAVLVYRYTKNSPSETTFNISFGTRGSPKKLPTNPSPTFSAFYRFCFGPQKGSACKFYNYVRPIFAGLGPDPKINVV